jgi:hypothetical protein
MVINRHSSVLASTLSFVNKDKKKIQAMQHFSSDLVACFGNFSYLCSEEIRKKYFENKKAQV